MNNTSKAISGTELVESILGGPDVDRLLAAFHNKEHAVLEFKASWKPCEGDDASVDDCRWNVIKAIIAMANASGGCIVLGIAENKSGNSWDSRGRLLAGDCDPDHILKNPRLEEKDLIEHTLSGLFKGDGFFKINTSSDRQEKLKVGHFDSLRDLVEPVKLCRCKAINGLVLVLVVHPCEKPNFIYVHLQPEARADNSNPRKVLFYRDSDLPKTHRIDDIEEMAQYCDKRKIEQPNYKRILINSGEGTPIPKPRLLVVFAAIVILALAACAGLLMQSQRIKKEAQRIEEEARKKEEEAQRKVDDAAKEVEIKQKRLEQLQASNTATGKELDAAQAQLDKAKKEQSSAKLAAEAAKQLAKETKEKANNALTSYKRLTEERERWNSYCDKVKNKQDVYHKNIKNHCTAFPVGLNTKTNSVSLRFDKARDLIPGIVNTLTTNRNIVLNLVKNAVDDRQLGKTGNSRICGYINTFLTDYFSFCFEGCESLVKDGKEYDCDLQGRFMRYKSDVIQTCSDTFTNEVEKILGQQIDSCQVPASMFPERIFKEDKERIDKTSEAISRLIIRGKAGKKAIDEMKSLLEKYPGTEKWQKTDVSELQKELNITVPKELNKILEALQRDSVKHVSNAAENARDAYLEAGKDLAKAATKKPTGKK